MPPELTHVTTPFTWQHYPSLINVGPLWFIAMLLIFDASYAARRCLAQARRLQSASERALPGYRALAAFILVLALASYMIRIVLPLGTPLLEFPSLAYLPQHASFFALGVLASRHGWFQSIPSSTGKIGLAVALLATLVLSPISLRGGRFLGGGFWQSVLYGL